MKRIIYIPAAIGVLAFGGIVLANTNTNEGLAPDSGNSTETQEKVPVLSANPGQGVMIGFERAASIALELAEGNVTDIELSEDDGHREYEVEIRNGEYEYDFDIDAFTGEVLEQDRERISNHSAASAEVKDDSKKEMSGDNDDANKAQDVQISLAQASDIALTEAGGGKVEEIELDWDDGLQYYEVEIINGDTEYELEINASDGSVLKFEQDDEEDDDDHDDDYDDNEDDEDDR